MNATPSDIVIEVDFQRESLCVLLEAINVEYQPTLVLNIAKVKSLVIA